MEKGLIMNEFFEFKLDYYCPECEVKLKKKKSHLNNEANQVMKCRKCHEEWHFNIKKTEKLINQSEN